MTIHALRALLHSWDNKVKDKASPCQRKTLGSQKPKLLLRCLVLVSSSDWPSVWELEGTMGESPEWAVFSHLKQLTKAW